MTARDGGGPQIRGSLLALPAGGARGENSSGVE